MAAARRRRVRRRRADARPSVAPAAASSCRRRCWRPRLVDAVRRAASSGRSDELVEEFFAISVERRIDASVRGRHHAGGARRAVRKLTSKPRPRHAALPRPHARALAAPGRNDGGWSDSSVVAVVRR
ncbi:MAG: hypothetical protein MZW92_66575 [Comamonadaceae bacterium]|nr:hypothetical protein [Comamonadaceae bacterium]